jgi:hypothetical protein
MWALRGGWGEVWGGNEMQRRENAIRLNARFQLPLVKVNQRHSQHQVKDGRVSDPNGNKTQSLSILAPQN